MKTNDLKLFENNDFKPGGKIKIGLWYLTNTILFKSYFFPFSSIKVVLLKIFGASVGKGINIKPNVNIKYPWFLSIGDYSWIGEEVWIDNLGQVTIGANACISQGAYLLTGNHNYKRHTFDLMVNGIIIDDGVWIGAKAIVCPGVNCKSHSILTSGSVATKDLEEYSIYQGNPATKIRDRVIN